MKYSEHSLDAGQKRWYRKGSRRTFSDPCYFVRGLSAQSVTFERSNSFERQVLSRKAFLSRFEPA